VLQDAFNLVVQHEREISEVLTVKERAELLAL
jgi:hypothetical protein